MCNDGYPKKDSVISADAPTATILCPQSLMEAVKLLSKELLKAVIS